MNILFITHYSSLYGANRSLLNLIDGLKTHKISVCVILPQEGDLTLQLKKRNIKYIIQFFYRWTAGEDDPIFKLKFLKNFRIARSNRKRRSKNYRLIKDLQGRLEQFEPDLICSNSSVFDFGFSLAQYLNKPHIWILRESQEQYNLKWLYGIGRVNRTFKKSNLILAVSHFLKEHYEKNNNLEDIKVLYNAVLSKKDLDILDQRRKSKQEIKSDKTFGIVGLLHPNKGQEEAIRAFSIVLSKYKDSRLVIAGAGEVKLLKSLTDELGLSEAVEFMGYLEDPFEAFLAMDVYLMCSKMEGLGRVTLEAMATAVPVIGYKEGGTKELIKEHFNGLFYKNGHEELAEQMIYFIENEEEVDRMGQNGRKDFENNFTSEVYARNFLNLIMSIPEVKKDLKD